MTNWTIQLCPNCPAVEEDEDALVDDGNGPDLIGGWGKGWEYIGGSAEPGDTVTVLEPDTRSAEELGYEEAPFGWSPFYDPEKHGPLREGSYIPPGWTFDEHTRRWNPPSVSQG